MTLPAVLAPLFVEVILTFVLMFCMAGLRAPLLMRGAVQPQDVDLRQPNWPRHVTKVANCFSNQFELPILFYVLTILVIVTRHADVLFVAMAWIFVLFRILHALVHTLADNLRLRGGLFGIGALVLALMWLIFIVRIMAGLP